jgi:hypothetical protein
MSIADVHIRCDLSSTGVVSYGLHINCASLDNAGSKYTNLVLGHSKPARLIPSSTYRYPTFTSCDEKGLWVNCRATNYAWRVAKDMDFSPEMWNCTAGIYSYGGDQENDTTGTGEIGGKFYNCVSGSYGFGGCDSFGMKSNVSSKYYGCIGSVGCFSIGKEFAGTAWNCYALTSSFGGYGSGAYYGTMSGKLYNCTMSDKSAGAGNANCANTGITQGCTITALSTPIYVGSGARIRQSYISVSTVDVDAISIIDDTSPPRIYDTTIEVNSAGTGVPINAGAAQTAFVAHCRMNNRDVDSDGLGANVTNLCSNDGQNVVENDI